MHESSTAGGGDEAPREDGRADGGAAEDGTAKNGSAKDGGATAAAPGGAPTDRTGAGGAVTPPPARDTVADAAGPQAPAEPRPRRAPERSQAEQDEIFAALVAQFDDPVDLNNPNWPEVENLRAQNGLKGGHKEGPAERGDRDDLADLAPQPRPRSGRPVLPAAGSGPRDFELEESDEGHFVPPEPPPLPEADVTTKFAWLAVLGGPALLLIDAVVWREISGWPAWIGVTAFLGGFVTLVARMRDRDEDEPEDPDHGAVV
ncbi:hypothetical protein [Streptomyces sp. NRRL S-350]|uniref:hypothetical protein n=1 Tax=Streptomyces sp. NRRL S-350 TaxID=1463902 RepID=UPI00068AEE17|nr:hypothetical protein [Streptomyces sp. NRRL S-350]